MGTSRASLLLVLACSLLTKGENDSHLVVDPESPVLEIGTDFMATCTIINTDEVTADDLYWNLIKTTVPKEQYTKINQSALNVTIPITTENKEWLFCFCKNVSPYVVLNKGKFIHGIMLTKGYRPGKPENLSCRAEQEGSLISATIRCEWDPVGRQTTDVPTTYTLNVRVVSAQTYTVATDKNDATISMDIFPSHMTLEIWVEAQNKLGKIESDHLEKDAGWFVKTNPPSDVKVISEKNFSTSLLISWTHPIAEEYVRLKYEIRFCPLGSQKWIYVPPADTNKYIQSFRLQNLHPDTVYVTQVRCRNARDGHGYWSDWSSNATKRTPEDRPTSKPDLWRFIAKDNHISEQQVTFICKDPVFSNGRITRFEIMIQKQKEKTENGSSKWESVLVNRSEADSSSSQQRITELKKIHLADKKSVQVNVTAVNSVGTSPQASLFIPDKTLEPVEELHVWPQGGQLWLSWKSPSSRTATEYVVEWVHGNHIDWQRETKTTRQTVIKGNLKEYVRYNVSVYPIYYGWIGKQASKEAYLVEEVPSEGPVVSPNGKPGRNKADLVWTEIPEDKRRGFITSYTIFYTEGTKTMNITVKANITSYTLTSLSANTKYDTWISASTIRGSKEGPIHSFITLKYEPWQIEGIVVGVSLGFLFVVLLTMLLCIYKKDVIKENFWPQIPNPGESTIGNWSPEYPFKAETPKENCLSGISVLDVDVCDGKGVFEEDKGSLPLKKDKYLSEEHSSGIGGSSCMSSPRQSVSDSDEGGDMADTTASTVQYSSVVASSGYKGQTPSSQPQQTIFSRSESTQPLLDSEENPDILLQEGSKQFQRFPQQSSFTHTAQNKESISSADFNQLEMEEQEVLEPLDFCSLKEDSKMMTPTDDHSADWLPVAPVSSYMPQLGGYRPQ